MPMVTWTKERMKYAMCFFPLIGVIIGACVIGFYQLFAALQMKWLTVVFPVLIPVIITGGIHMDGFLDVTDARASHAEREKKLEILKDPHTGAFAMIGCVLYFLFYIAVFGEMNPSFIMAYAGIFVLTRSLSGLAVVTFPMAKNSGLAATFSGQAEKKKTAITMIVYTVASVGYLVYTGGVLTAVLTTLAAGLTYGYYYWMAKKEFGGITGDLAGYFLQICELVLAAVLAAVSHIAI